MAVKKSQLYSSLWASCDKLRGGMDASQYKDYILTLLFVKYVSDKYTEEKLSQTENEFEEFVEENCVDDAEDDELSQEPEILKKCKAYEASIKSQKKTIADLKKKLDENCRKRYDAFTDSEITDLLVNRKWYKTIDRGVQNLYVTVANHLTKRIVELYERYENTLPELTAKLAEEEKEVSAHLAQMGFKL